MTATEPYVVTTERYIPGPVYLDQLTTNAFSVGGSPVTGFTSPSGAQVGQVPVFTGPGTGSYQSVVDAGPWVFDVRTFGAVGDGQCATDGVITTGTNILTCATSAPFKPSDVGKAVMVKNALTSGATSLVTTITGYTSPTQVALGANATASVVSGGRVFWATDDTVPIQKCINAAFAYGQKTGIGIIWIPPGSGLFYGIAGPLVAGGDTAANGQLVIPINPRVGGKAVNNKVVLWFLGATDGGTTRHWEQLVPQMGGSTLVSFGVWANATAQLNSLNANGSPAVISGQTGANGWGTSTLQYNNVLVRMQNMQVYTTHSASGFTYSALNLHGVAAAALENFGYGTTGLYADADFNNPNGFSAGLSIGVLLPSAGNNDNNVMSNVVCHGGYTRGLFMTEHTAWKYGVMLYCWSGICPVGNYGDGGSGVGASHGMHLEQISIEGCNQDLEIIGPGQSGIGPMLSGSFDTEGASVVRDNASGMVAACGVVYLKGNGGTPPTLSAGTPLQVICDFQFPGVPPSAAPALTINTAVQSPFGRWANITLSGGLVTSVQLGSLMGGASAPTMTTVHSQASGVLTGFTVRVGPQGWVQVNGTTTPTEAIWWLE